MNVKSVKQCKTERFLATFKTVTSSTKGIHLTTEIHVSKRALFHNTRISTHAKVTSSKPHYLNTRVLECFMKREGTPKTTYVTYDQMLLLHLFLHVFVIFLGNACCVHSVTICGCGVCWVCFSAFAV